jgi:hypothetical protein
MEMQLAPWQTGSALEALTLRDLRKNEFPAARLQLRGKTRQMTPWYRQEQCARLAMLFNSPECCLSCILNFARGPERAVYHSKMMWKLIFLVSRQRLFVSPQRQRSRPTEMPADELHLKIEHSQQQVTGRSGNSQRQQS